MADKYVKLTKTGVWHRVVGSPIFTACGRSMPHKTDGFYGTSPVREPWVATSEIPDGPICRACSKAIAKAIAELGL